jgi:hypothetical protein
MKLINIVILFFGINASAGGFYCTSTEDASIIISGTTGGIDGKPLITDLFVTTSSLDKQYSKSSVVGYWHLDNELKFAVYDDTIMGIGVKLITKKNLDTYLYEGSVFIKEKSYPVTCGME